MGYIEDLKESLLKSREEWVGNTIDELTRVRQIIEADFAKGKGTTQVPFVNCQVGYVDEFVRQLQPWFDKEPSTWGVVKLSVSNDDRNNIDHLIAKRA